ncbi:sugar-binding transcriptional regulator [Nanchangia anserum]|uniref:Sugar-binding transcriptional regulator n=1 Tax=Nanchangia anserum TaxID=2692125 RepID=A0A8I0GDQ5_9ACTO|nr:sugar-binding transcriptional regulator [Nanchangia anserum]MBD3689658.1 sugar-binding transcriptional regulator [Nanchangia anserum]QOX81839.1 sugar-binding transcriptional regulator [Nanchangia anserum]
MDRRDEQALDAVKLYFDKGLSQADVARELGVSRPTASKLISYGKRRGYVSIQINDPREARSELAHIIRARYHLDDVRVAHAPREARGDVLRELGTVGAGLLTSLVHDGDSIGISWGDTMYALARELTEYSVRDVQIVQLKGGHSHSQRSTHDWETMRLFAAAFGASTLPLPLPIIFDNVQTKQVVEEDRHIASVLEAGRSCDIAVFTVGDVSRGSLPLNLGYLSEDELTELRSRAVGDVCSRFFTKDGEIAVPSIDERTIGITIEDLTRCPTRLLVAGGPTKVNALRVALSRGIATHLVTDERTAAHLAQ